MKKIFTLATAIIFSMNAFCQLPGWQWAQRIGDATGFDFDRSFDITTDANGYVYLLGSATTASLTIGSFTLTGGGTIIVKLDTSGNVVWAKNILDIFAMSYGIVVDESGYIYVSGSFTTDSVQFGNVVLHNSVYNDRNELFVAKFDTTGNVMWAKSGGTESDDMSQGITIDNAGSIYVTGTFPDDTLVFGNVSLLNTGASDCFILKLDTSGNALWAKGVGASSGDIDVDAQCNVYITGAFHGDSLTIGNSVIFNTGAFAFFIAKFDSSGNAIWGRSSTANNFDMGNNIAVDYLTGNSYVAGIFHCASIAFGPYTINNCDAGANWNDIFTVKYDSSGNPLWAQGAGGIGDDTNWGTDVDVEGNCYVTGSFVGDTMDFGNTPLLNAGLIDAFIAKYSITGNLVGALSIGGTGSDEGQAIAVDLHGNSYTTGIFRNTVIIGSTSLVNTSSYFPDIYIARADSGAIVSGIDVLPFFHDDISLFPNPVTDLLKIRSAKFNLQLAEVYDAIGARCISLSLNAQNSASIDVSVLSRGIYFVRIIYGEKNLVRKLIVE